MISNIRYSGYHLNPSVYPYETITLYGAPFQATSGLPTRVEKMDLQHHISLFFQIRIQFALSCFQSLLLTASHLISFPAGTKMFQFPAFPDLTASKMKSYSDISGSKTTCVSPEHKVACHFLHRHLSLVIHLTA